MLFSVGGPGQSGLDDVELDSELKHNLFLSGSLQDQETSFTLIKSSFPSLVPASAHIFSSSCSTSFFTSYFPQVQDDPDPRESKMSAAQRSV